MSLIPVHECPHFGLFDYFPDLYALRNFSSIHTQACNRLPWRIEPFSFWYILLWWCMVRLVLKLRNWNARLNTCIKHGHIVRTPFFTTHRCTTLMVDLAFITSDYWLVAYLMSLRNTATSIKHSKFPTDVEIWMDWLIVHKNVSFFICERSHFYLKFDKLVLIHRYNRKLGWSRCTKMQIGKMKNVFSFLVVLSR